MIVLILALLLPLLVSPLRHNLHCFLLVEEVSLDPSMHLGVVTPELVHLWKPQVLRAAPVFFWGGEDFVLVLLLESYWPRYLVHKESPVR